MGSPDHPISLRMKLTQLHAPPNLSLGGACEKSVKSSKAKDFSANVFDIQAHQAELSREGDMLKRTIITFQSFRHHFLLFASILAIILILNPPRVGAAGGGHYSIPARAIQPVDSTVGFNSFSGYLITTSESTESFGMDTFIASVNLPDGATISAVHVYGIDSDPDANFSARMYRYQATDPVATPVTDRASSSGSIGNTVIDLPIPDGAAAMIDNETYSYTVNIYQPEQTTGSLAEPALAILRIVIDWSYSVYLPAVSK